MRRQKLKRILFWTAVLLALLLLASVGVILRAVVAVSAAARTASTAILPVQKVRL